MPEAGLPGLKSGGWRPGWAQIRVPVFSGRDRPITACDFLFLLFNSKHLIGRNKTQLFTIIFTIFI